MKQNICAAQELLVFTFPTIVGFSFFSSIPAMVQVLSDTHGKVWKLSRGSPFPDELQIDYQGGKHGNIKPKSGSRLTKEQLEEVN